MFWIVFVQLPHPGTNETQAAEFAFEGPKENCIIWQVGEAAGPEAKKLALNSFAWGSFAVSFLVASAGRTSPLPPPAKARWRFSAFVSVSKIWPELAT